MIDAIVASGSPVKSQQLGEPDLTADEKKRALIEQYKTKPLVFLERYHAHLQPEHLEAFGHVSSDCRTRHYCTEVQKRASQLTNRTRVRNHRYAALRALQEGMNVFPNIKYRYVGMLQNPHEQNLKLTQPEMYRFIFFNHTNMSPSNKPECWINSRHKM